MNKSLATALMGFLVDLANPGNWCNYDDSGCPKSGRESWDGEGIHPQDSAKVLIARLMLDDASYVVTCDQGLITISQNGRELFRGQDKAELLEFIYLTNA